MWRFGRKSSMAPSSTQTKQLNKLRGALASSDADDAKSLSASCTLLAEYIAGQTDDDSMQRSIELSSFCPQGVAKFLKQSTKYLLNELAEYDKPSRTYSFKDANGLGDLLSDSCELGGKMLSLVGWLIRFEEHATQANDASLSGTIPLSIALTHALRVLFKSKKPAPKLVGVKVFLCQISQFTKVTRFFCFTLGPCGSESRSAFDVLFEFMLGDHLFFSVIGARAIQSILNGFIKCQGTTKKGVKLESPRLLSEMKEFNLSVKLLVAYIKITRGRGQSYAEEEGGNNEEDHEEPPARYQASTENNCIAMLEGFFTMKLAFEAEIIATNTTEFLKKFKEHEGYTIMKNFILYIGRLEHDALRTLSEEKDLYSQDDISGNYRATLLLDDDGTSSVTPKTVNKASLVQAGLSLVQELVFTGAFEVKMGNKTADPIDGLRVRNVDAFLIFQQVFLEAADGKMALQVFDIIEFIINVHKENNQVVDQEHMVAMLLRQYEALDDDRQRCILQLIEEMCGNPGFGLPHKALSLLPSILLSPVKLGAKTNKKDSLLPGVRTSITRGKMSSEGIRRLLRGIADILLVVRARERARKVSAAAKAQESSADPAFSTKGDGALKDDLVAAWQSDNYMWKVALIEACFRQVEILVSRLPRLVDSRGGYFSPLAGRLVDESLEMAQQELLGFDSLLDDPNCFASMVEILLMFREDYPEDQMWGPLKRLILPLIVCASHRDEALRLIHEILDAKMFRRILSLLREGLANNDWHLLISLMGFVSEVFTQPAKNDVVSDGVEDDSSYPSTTVRSKTISVRDGVCSLAERAENLQDQWRMLDDGFGLILDVLHSESVQESFRKCDEGTYDVWELTKSCLELLAWATHGHTVNHSLFWSSKAINLIAEALGRCGILTSTFDGHLFGTLLCICCGGYVTQEGNRGSLDCSRYFNEIPPGSTVHLPQAASLMLHLLPKARLETQEIVLDQLQTLAGGKGNVRNLEGFARAHLGMVILTNFGRYITLAGCRVAQNEPRKDADSRIAHRFYKLFITITAHRISPAELSQLTKICPTSYHHTLMRSITRSHAYQQGMCGRGDEWNSLHAIEFGAGDGCYAGMRIPDCPDFLVPDTGVTISLWIYLRNDQDGNQQPLKICEIVVEETQGKAAAANASLLLYRVAMRHRRLQVSSTNYSVTFDGCRMPVQKWCHVVLVHRPGRLMRRSTLTLFVDGKKYETQKLRNPVQSKGGITGNLRIYFGTLQPPQGGPKTTGGGDQRVWCLSSLLLLKNNLDAGKVVELYRLGVHYAGTVHLKRAFAGFATDFLAEGRAMTKDHPDDFGKIHVINNKNERELCFDQLKIILSFEPKTLTCMRQGKGEHLVEQHGDVKMMGRCMQFAAINIMDAIRSCGGVKMIQTLIARLPGVHNTPSELLPLFVDEQKDLTLALVFLQLSLFENYRNLSAMAQCNGYKMLSTIFMSSQHIPLISKTIVHILFNIASGKIPKIPSPEEDLTVVEQCDDPGHGFINQLAIQDLLLRPELWVRTTLPVQQALYSRILMACTRGPTIEDRRKSLLTGPSSSLSRQGLFAPGFYSSYAAAYNKDTPPLCRWNPERFRQMGVIQNILDFTLMIEEREKGDQLLGLVATMGSILEAIILNYVEETDVKAMFTFITLGLGRAGSSKSKIIERSFLMLQNLDDGEKEASNSDLSGAGTLALSCMKSFVQLMHLAQGPMSDSHAHARAHTLTKHFDVRWIVCLIQPEVNPRIVNAAFRLLAKFYLQSRKDKGQKKKSFWSRFTKANYWSALRPVPWGKAHSWNILVLLFDLMFGVDSEEILKLFRDSENVSDSSIHQRDFATYMMAQKIVLPECIPLILGLIRDRLLLSNRHFDLYNANPEAFRASVFDSEWGQPLSDDGNPSSKPNLSRPTSRSVVEEEEEEPVGELRSSLNSPKGSDADSTTLRFILWLFTWHPDFKKSLLPYIETTTETLAFCAMQPRTGVTSSAWSVLHQVITNLCFEGASFLNSKKKRASAKDLQFDSEELDDISEYEPGTGQKGAVGRTVSSRPVSGKPRGSARPSRTLTPTSKRREKMDIVEVSKIMGYVFSVSGSSAEEAGFPLQSRMLDEMVSRVDLLMMIDLKSPRGKQLLLRLCHLMEVLMARDEVKPVFRLELAVGRRFLSAILQVLSRLFLERSILASESLAHTVALQQHTLVLVNSLLATTIADTSHCVEMCRLLRAGVRVLCFLGSDQVENANSVEESLELEQGYLLLLADQRAKINQQLSAAHDDDDCVALEQKISMLDAKPALVANLEAAAGNSADLDKFAASPKNALDGSQGKSILKRRVVSGTDNPWSALPQARVVELITNLLECILVWLKKEDRFGKVLEEDEQYMTSPLHITADDNDNDEGDDDKPKLLTPSYSSGKLPSTFEYLQKEALALWKSLCQQHMQTVCDIINGGGNSADDSRAVVNPLLYSVAQLDLGLDSDHNADTERMNSVIIQVIALLELLNVRAKGPRDKTIETQTKRDTHTSPIRLSRMKPVEYSCPSFIAKVQIQHDICLQERAQSNFRMHDSMRKQWQIMEAELRQQTHARFTIEDNQLPRLRCVDFQEGPSRQLKKMLDCYDLHSILGINFDELEEIASQHQPVVEETEKQVNYRNELLRLMGVSRSTPLARNSSVCSPPLFSRSETEESTDERVKKALQGYQERYKRRRSMRKSHDISNVSFSNGSEEGLTSDNDEDEHQHSDKSAKLPEKGKIKKLPDVLCEEKESDDEDGQEDNQENEDEELEDDIAWSKLKRLLEPGDQLLKKCMFNCQRIEGLETREAILVLCKENIYVIDDFVVMDGNPEEIPANELMGKTKNICFQVEVTHGTLGNTINKSTGEEISPCRRPERTEGVILKVAKSATKNTRSHRVLERKSYRKSYTMIRNIFERRYLLRDVALEFFNRDGTNFMLVFETKQHRRSVYNRVHRLSEKLYKSMQAKNDVAGPKNGGGVDTLGMLNKSGWVHSALKRTTHKWVSGAMSNYAYLMFLNTFAGRSYNDLTQYPVFPWILKDYYSEELDLKDTKVYRDLSKPMGAQGATRAETFQERFENWDDPDIDAFHYGSHYSSSGIVLFYLVRLLPFSRVALEHQGGYFDHADRLFKSVAAAWENASGLGQEGSNGMGSLQDVKELIPEWYCNPELFFNDNRFDLGRTQDGESVHDVELPPWACGDPRMFVRLLRRALESDYVSANLHKWIDLIFGHKQRGPASISALNVFYYLTYEGAVDIDAIEDDLERRACLSQINNFGQTPKQLFKKPHPARKVLSEFQWSPNYHTSPQSVNYGDPNGSISSEPDKPSEGEGDDSKEGSGKTLTPEMSVTVPSDDLKGLKSPLSPKAKVRPMEQPAQRLRRLSLTQMSTNKSVSMTFDFPTGDGVMPETRQRSRQKFPGGDDGVQEESATTIDEPSPLSHRSNPYQEDLPVLLMRDTTNLSDKEKDAALADGQMGKNMLTVVSRPDLLHPQPISHTHTNNQTSTAEREKSKMSIAGLYWDGVKLQVVEKKQALVPSKYNLILSHEYPDGGIRLLSAGTNQVLAVYENLHDEEILCTLVSANGRFVITGSSDSTIIVHQLVNQDLLFCSTLHSHSGAVTCLAESSAYNVLISGGEDGRVFVWDMTRMQLLHRLATHAGPITSVAVDDLSGDIATSAGDWLILWDVNGNYLASTNLRSERAFQAPIIFSGGQSGGVPSAVPTCPAPRPYDVLGEVVSEPDGWKVSSIDFAEASGGSSGEGFLIVTGHVDGSIRLWSLEFASLKTRRGSPPSQCPDPLLTPPLEGLQKQNKMYLHMRAFFPASPASHQCPITAIHASRLDYSKMWTADVSGQLRGWTATQTTSHWISDNRITHCSCCQNKFSRLISSRHHCRLCGRIFCGKCSSKKIAIPDYGFYDPVRVCDACYTFLNTDLAKLGR